MKRDKKTAMDRRNFLRSMGGASTVAIAAVASPMAASEAEAYNPGNEETKGRYRESVPVLPGRRPYRQPVHGD